MSPETLQETILVISASSAQAEQVKNAINLRGQEAIATTTFDQANDVIQQLKPVLSIVDLAILAENQVPFVKHLSQHSPVLVIAPEFQEEYFLNVHDAGAKDFLIKPVPEAYLAARILSILEQGRLQKRLSHREGILKDYGVISPRCEALSTNYMIETLKKATLNVSNPNTLSLLIVDLAETLEQLPTETQNSLYQPIVNILSACARGTDVVGEFLESKLLILMPNTEINGAESLRNRLQEKLGTINIQHQNNTLKLHPSIGIANYTGCKHYESFINKALNTKASTPKAASISHPF